MSTLLSDLIRFADGVDCRAVQNAPMSEYTSFKTGGCARLMLFPNSAECLSGILALCEQHSCSPVIIGNGSNLLVSDSGIDGVVIRIGQELSDIALEDETHIVCSAGVSLARLCLFALENSLTGLEFAYGIPGTAGGAAFMNAGAYGGEMKDVLTCCEHLTANGTLGSFSGDELGLAYRRSVYSENHYVITRLHLSLQKGDSGDIRAKMDELLSRRKDKQPLEYPSAGSTFKRPEGHYAGALIEQCGLKGANVGGAYVSEKHAGFIVNKNKATSTDIMLLIELVQNTVYAKTGVVLEPEVRFIGF